MCRDGEKKVRKKVGLPFAVVILNLKIASVKEDVFVELGKGVDGD